MDLMNNYSIRKVKMPKEITFHLSFGFVRHSQVFSKSIDHLKDEKGVGVTVKKVLRGGSDPRSKPFTFSYINLIERVLVSYFF